MRCSNCGSTVPEGSDFCNHCGTRLNKEMVCPSCGTVIPSDSQFCPKCGKKVLSENTISFEEQQGRERAEARREQQQRQQEEWRRRQLANNRDDDDDDDEEESSNYYRNLIIGIVAVVAIIIGLLAMRGCNSGKNDRKEENTEKTQKTAQPTGQDPMAILAAELGRNNLLGDGANPAAAVMVPGDANQPDRVWGVTYKPTNAGSDRAYYKIYQLTRSGSSWNPELMHTKYLDGRNVTFDPAALNVELAQVPREVKVNGKDYLYFAYMNNLGNEGSRGRVSLNLFDMAAKKLISLDYEGEIKSRNDRRLYIYGNPLDPINSPERQFLKQETEKVKILYFPTAEELKAEEEALAKAEEEKRLADPDSASTTWSKENKDKLEAAKNGEEVDMKTPTYDKPIFNMKDKNKTVQNEGYIVFSDTKGSVYGFNKSTRKYFTIYSPSGGATEPTDIGFGDSKNNILRYRTADGRRFSYNLVTGATKAIE